MRVAVLADIHGNLLALDAVLHDLTSRGGAELIVNLGDCVSGPLWPRQSVERLLSLEALTVRGNHDRQVATMASEGLNASDQFAASELTREQRRWLAALPLTATVARGLLACHGTPGRDDAYLIDNVRDGKLVRGSAEQISAKVSGVAPGTVVLCGHSHRRDLVRLPTGVLVLNPGSVGCPAYDDNSDPAHVSETGSPHARYAILTFAEQGNATSAQVDFVAVPYPWEVAARRAAGNGRPEWAHALQTGFMPSRGPLA